MPKKLSQKYIVGVDEVGRGPIAGPVTLCAFKIEAKNLKILDKLWKKGIKDSKKLTAENREEIFKKINELKNAGLCDYKTCSVSAKKIDEKGISFCIKFAINKCLQKLDLNPKNTLIKLDGLLHAPEIFKNQQTIIKGDEKESVIAIASIVAKVKRDGEMKKMSKKYSEYGFESNKGYGTVYHRAKIGELGLSAIHRRTYCKNIAKS